MGCDCSGEYQNIASKIKQGSSSIQNQINNTGDSLDQTLYGKALKGSKTAAGADAGTAGSGPGEHGAIGSLRFCNWAAPEYGPTGEFNWTDAFRAAALAISIANGLAQSKIADMQQDLADSYYSMAKSKWDRFYGKFVPLEKALLDEVLTEPETEPDCAADRKRAKSWTDRAYGTMEPWAGQKAKAMRLCMSDAEQRFMSLRRERLLDDTANYNYGDDRWFCDWRNDRRWNRRSSVLNLGRNLGTEALKYGDLARSLLNSVGGRIEQAASGVVNALGYYGARLDTYYPTSYLGQQNGNIVNIGQSIGAGSSQLAGMGGQFGG